MAWVDRGSLSISFQELPPNNIVATQASFSNFPQKSWFIVGTDGTAVRQSWDGSQISSFNGTYQGKILVTKFSNHGFAYKLVDPSTGEESDVDLNPSLSLHGGYSVTFEKGERGSNSWARQLRRQPNRGPVLLLRL